MSNHTILVVDDEMLTRNMLKMLFTVEGYDVVEAEDGVEALKMVAEHQPRWMVLDVMMPHMDGIEVCKRLKEDEKTADIMIVILSGGKFKEKALAVGADVYMEKPMKMDELLVLFAKDTA